MAEIKYFLLKRDTEFDYLTNDLIIIIFFIYILFFTYFPNCILSAEIQ
jgi:hypothetical protein